MISPVVEISIAGGGADEKDVKSRLIVPLVYRASYTSYPIPKCDQDIYSRLHYYLGFYAAEYYTACFVGNHYYVVHLTY